MEKCLRSLFGLSLRDSERNKERGCEREASILEGVDLSVLKWIEYMKRMTGKGLIKNGVYGGRGGSR